MTFSFPQMSKIKEIMLENKAIKEANIAEVKALAQVNCTRTVCTLYVIQSSTYVQYIKAFKQKT